jgi:transcriptional antiterminator RfaH
MTIKRPLPETLERDPYAHPGAGGQTDWYVAAATPRKERFALANLHNQGFTTFYPMMHKAQPGKTAMPLFPGYIFVGLNPHRARWQSINGTFGIRYLVGPRGALPSSVPAPVMDELFHRFPLGVHETPACRFHRGDRVDVMTGAFAGIPATFEDMLSHDRIRVLLDWLNTKVAVIMPSSCINTAA